MTRFSPARDERLSPSKQIAAAIKESIDRGIYRSGAKLPTLVELAKMFGTGLKAPRTAVAALVAEGLLVADRGKGITVVKNDRRGFRGRVLLIHGGTPLCYHINAVYSSIMERLSGKRYRVEQFLVPYSEKERSIFSLRDIRKECRASYDLVVAMGFWTPIIAEVSASGVPFVMIGGDYGNRPQGCIGQVVNDSARAIGAFAGRCRDKMVRKVLQVGFDGCGNDASETLRLFGIGCEQLRIAIGRNRQGVDGFCRPAFEAISARLARGRIPELVYFRDDYLAEGGLFALERAGLRAPRDLGVVTLLNRGLPLAYDPEPTRIECDPFAIGDTIASMVDRYLSTGEESGTEVVQASFVPGGTF